MYQEIRDTKKMGVLRTIISFFMAAFLRFRSLDHFSKINIAHRIKHVYFRLSTK